MKKNFSCDKQGKHVFVAYRVHARDIARKLASYLERNKIDVWFFPWKVGWGDSITAEEERGIADSFAGLIVFTHDFLEGRTATEEYRALAAKKRQDPHFKLSILRVNCPRELVPPFLKDYFDAEVSSGRDPKFPDEAKKIMRGICGLSIEPSPSEFKTISARSLPHPNPPQAYLVHPYPLQLNFTGRQEEREKMKNWLVKGTHSMLALLGIGGMGKSALAWYWLLEDVIGEDKGCKGVIWWSFYEQGADFDAFLEVAISYVTAGTVDPKALPSTRERMDFLWGILAEQKFLLVLDGIERTLFAYNKLSAPYMRDIVPNSREDYRVCVNPNLGLFLSWLASGYHQTKTLITSRLLPLELEGLNGCMLMELSGMSPEDSVTFFKRQGVKGTFTEIKNVCKSYKYLPLALRLLSGTLATDPEFRGEIKHAQDLSIIDLSNISSKKRDAAKMNHILDFAYRRLSSEDQLLISRIAAFRFTMSFEALRILDERKDGGLFKKRLNNLVNRGLLLYDSELYKYDVHPIVRHYCYNLLIDKKQTHMQLSDYFASMPEPEEIESFDDLLPIIELYHHTVNAGRYDQAIKLYRQRLHSYLYHHFCSYATCIELLSALLTNGGDVSLKVEKKADQSYVLSCLGSAYCLAGKPRRAYSFQTRCLDLTNDIYEIVIFLWNIAYDQFLLGDLKKAESILHRLKETFNDEQWKSEREFWKDSKYALGLIEFHEAMSRGLLALVYAYMGKVKTSEYLFKSVLKTFVKLSDYHHLSFALHGLCQKQLIEKAKDSALQSARRAYEIAFQDRNERDKVVSAWLLGATHILLGDLSKAEEYLSQALLRCRRISLMEVEALILLDLAHLRYVQMKSKKHKLDKEELQHEVIDLTQEALEIAHRCEYRLQQTNIHNFLAHVFIDSKDIQEARKHADVGYEFATTCGYKSAQKEAKHLLGEIEKCKKSIKKNICAHA